MKYIFSILVLSWILSSCHEIGPPIDFKGEEEDSINIDTTWIAIDSSITPQLKNVLIEDFTGVRCPNCPKAGTELENLMAAHPGRIIGIAVHTSNLYGLPFDKSKQDFRTPEGAELWTIMNGQSQPAGCVDRVLFATEPRIPVTYPNWNNYATQRLSTGNSPVKICVKTEYDTTIHLWEVYVEVFYNVARSDSEYLSVALVEDSIRDLQELPTLAIDSHYHHNHILRKMLTPYLTQWGNSLNASLVQKRIFYKEFKFNPQPLWVTDNMRVVAYVSKYDGTNYEILQTVETKLIK